MGASGATQGAGVCRWVTLRVSWAVKLQQVRRRGMASNAAEREKRIWNSSWRGDASRYRTEAACPRGLTTRRNNFTGEQPSFVKATALPLVLPLRDRKS